MNILKIKIIFTSVIFFWSPLSTAEFVMNFVPVDSTFGDHSRTDTSCNRPDVTDLYCGGSWSNSGDPTPFLQEVILIDGKDYYHVIVGLPEDGFAQEFFMATSTFYQGGSGTSSLGDGICRYGSGSYAISQCNMGDALGQTHDNVFTGNGSGDPRSIMIRQVMGGTWDSGDGTWSCAPGDEFCLEYTKDNFLTKPKTTMTIRDPTQFMQSYFEVDLSNSDYTQNTVLGSIVNTMQITSPEVIGADFDMDIDANIDWLNVSAGLYTFTGTGPTNATLNPYDYFEGSFDLNQPWWRYHLNQ